MKCKLYADSKSYHFRQSTVQVSCEWIPCIHSTLTFCTVGWAHMLQWLHGAIIVLSLLYWTVCGISAQLTVNPAVYSNVTSHSWSHLRSVFINLVWNMNRSSEWKSYFYYYCFLLLSCFLFSSSPPPLQG